MPRIKDGQQEVWKIAFIPAEFWGEQREHVDYASYAVYFRDLATGKEEYQGITGMSGFSEEGMHHDLAKRLAKAKQENPDLTFRVKKTTPRWLILAFLEALDNELAALEPKNSET